MGLESDADRRALLDIDGVDVRIFSDVGPQDIRAQFDEATEEIGGTGFQIEILEGAPTLYVIFSDVGRLAVGDRIEVLEGPGAGSYTSKGTIKEDDGAFARVALADNS